MPAPPLDDRIRSRTGIIATLGPATIMPGVLKQVVEAGCRIFRLNFSHGDLEDHRRNIRDVRALEAEMDIPLALMCDLPGPKIRVIEVAGDGIDVEVGEEVFFDRDQSSPCVRIEQEPPVLGCTWTGIVDCVKPGDRVLINDGAVRLLATEVSDGRLQCRVTTGGLITSHKGVNLPDSELDIVVPTPRDMELVAWAIKNDVDLVAMSFVRSPEEIERIRSIMQDNIDGTGHERPLPIIAKIEVPPAVASAEEIIAAADGVMVARGDLGVEMDLAQVPIIQKRLISIARKLDRPCIVATQMLQSMVDAPVPTRAEASDVANAIFDGADAVMLSGETAIGRYPVLAVETMQRIAHESEAWLDSSDMVCCDPVDDSDDQAVDDTHALVAGIHSAARSVRAKCIVVFSEWGTWSRLISRGIDTLPIVAYTPRQSVVRQMLLCRGVIPELMEVVPDEAILSRDAQHRLADVGWIDEGDAIIVVLGRPLKHDNHSVRITVHRFGDGGRA